MLLQVQLLFLLLLLRVLLETPQVLDMDIMRNISGYIPPQRGTSADAAAFIGGRVAADTEAFVEPKCGGCAGCCCITLSQPIPFSLPLPVQGRPL